MLEISLNCKNLQVQEFRSFSSNFINVTCPIQCRSECYAKSLLMGEFEDIETAQRFLCCFFFVLVNRTGKHFAMFRLFASQQTKMKLLRGRAAMSLHSNVINTFHGIIQYAVIVINSNCRFQASWKIITVGDSRMSPGVHQITICG